jgi:hypothetical protein
MSQAGTAAQRRGAGRLSLPDTETAFGNVHVPPLERVNLPHSHFRLLEGPKR